MGVLSALAAALVAGCYTSQASTPEARRSESSTKYTPGEAPEMPPLPPGADVVPKYPDKKPDDDPDPVVDAGAPPPLPVERDGATTPADATAEPADAAPPTDADS